jgi:hypothetical protein
VVTRYTRLIKGVFTKTNRYLLHTFLNCISICYIKSCLGFTALCIYYCTGIYVACLSHNGLTIFPVSYVVMCTVHQVTQDNTIAIIILITTDTISTMEVYEIYVTEYFNVTRIL